MKRKSAISKRSMMKKKLKKKWKIVEKIESKFEMNILV